jgi:hypothetical protein
VLLDHLATVVQCSLDFLVNFDVVQLLVGLLDKVHINAIWEAEVFYNSALLTVGLLLTMDVEVARCHKDLVASVPILA